MKRSTTNYSAPYCLRYFSEFALTFSGGFIFKDFLKLSNSIFFISFERVGFAKAVPGISTFGKTFSCQRQNFNGFVEL